MHKGVPLAAEPPYGRASAAACAWIQVELDRRRPRAEPHYHPAKVASTALLAFSTRPASMPSCALAFHSSGNTRPPQQATLPSARSPQAWSQPAEICANVPEGVASMYPQQATLPSVRRPQV